LSAIVLGEYRFGIAHSLRRDQHESWLERLIAATRILAVGNQTSIHYAHIRAELKKAGRPFPSNDLRIAALARQHRTPLMSHDKNFEAVQHLMRMEW
jgi:tRNA(fMet)-specific endonuclease VapC